MSRDMTTENLRAAALDSLAAAQVYAEMVPRLHARYHAASDGPVRPGASTVAARETKSAEAQVRHGVKVAEVNALLYIGDQISELCELLHLATAGGKQTDVKLTFNHSGDPAEIGRNVADALAKFRGDPAELSETELDYLLAHPETGV